MLIVASLRLLLQIQAFFYFARKHILSLPTRSCKQSELRSIRLIQWIIQISFLIFIDLMFTSKGNLVRTLFNTKTCSYRQRFCEFPAIFKILIYISSLQKISGVKTVAFVGMQLQKESNLFQKLVTGSPFHQRTIPFYFPCNFLQKRNCYLLWNKVMFSIFCNLLYLIFHCSHRYFSLVSNLSSRFSLAWYANSRFPRLLSNRFSPTQWATCTMNTTKITIFLFPSNS